jgi:hypothetical protein
LAVASLLALSCGKLPQDDEAPALDLRQGPPGSVVLPNPIPSATPTPPVPGASASPAPQPSATAAPVTSSCRLPSMAECGGPEDPAGVFGCCTKEGNSLFLDIVDTAIAQIQREQPNLFSGDRVLNPNAYVQGVARILETRGFCARQGGPEDEVAVKNSNGFSEQFDILFSSGIVRTGGYTVTCRPARF